MKRLLQFVTVVVLAAFASGLLRAQSNPAVGTWKLNLAKSKASPGPLPKSLTRTIEAQGAGIKGNYEGVAADGSRIAYSFALNYDGKDYPISGSGVNGADSLSAKRIDANTTESQSKKAGKVVQETKTVVSKDGKVTTQTSKGTNQKGQPTSAVSVYDKQ